MRIYPAYGVRSPEVPDWWRTGNSAGRGGVEFNVPCECVLIAYLGISWILDGPPRTLRVEIDSWQNPSWGVHAIDRHQFHCSLAISSNGSRASQCEYKSFRSYFWADRPTSLRTVYLRPENLGYRYDENARIHHNAPCSCTWTLKRVRADDGDCRARAAEELPTARRVGTGSTAGHPVIRYRMDLESGRTIEQSFAPGLACEVMELIDTWPGTLGIPGARYQYRVTSYQPGEPDKSEFQLPPG